MKYLIILSAIVSIGLLCAGLYFNLQGDPLMHKMYGFGTIGLFLITFPLFLFWRKDKISMDKYVWKNPKDQKKDEDKSSQN